MYTPKSFAVNDQTKLENFIKQNSFGVLFSQSDDGPFATHLPFLVEEGRLLSHMAKPNPHWKSLDSKEVLAIFSGPHAYISPTWYSEENTVPTWNYVAVHVTGMVRIIEDQQEIKQLIEKTVNFYEANMPSPWEPDFNNSFIDGLMNGIVGLDIQINKIEGKWKLSQNHSIQRQQNLVNGLKNNHQYQASEIATLMEQNILEQSEKK